MLLCDCMARIDLQCASEVAKCSLWVIILFPCDAPVYIDVRITLNRAQCRVVPVDCRGEIPETHFRQTDVVEQVSLLCTLSCKHLACSARESICLEEYCSCLSLRKIGEPNKVLLRGIIPAKSH